LRFNLFRSRIGLPDHEIGVALLECSVCSMTINQQSKRATYFILLALQSIGAIIFIVQELPDFRQVVLSPGDQLPKDIRSDFFMISVFLGMQLPFWFRLRYISIPTQRPNPLLNHVFLFLGRLSFIFGSALFSVVVFRHIPEMGRETEMLLAVGRGIIFVACLFALFCTSLELERLAHAFEGRPN
jgi:hypothetical protein